MKTLEDALENYLDGEVVIVMHLTKKQVLSIKGSAIKDELLTATKTEQQQHFYTMIPRSVVETILSNNESLQVFRLYEDNTESLVEDYEDYLKHHTDTNAIFGIEK